MHIIGIAINHPVLQEYVLDGITCPVEIEVFKSLVYKRIITTGAKMRRVW